MYSRSSQSNKCCTVEVVKVIIAIVKSSGSNYCVVKVAIGSQSNNYCIVVVKVKSSVLYK